MQAQSHLVEVLTGIQTVKAQNVEIVSRWKWQEKYSEYIARTFGKRHRNSPQSNQSGIAKDFPTYGALGRR